MFLRIFLMSSRKALLLRCLQRESLAASRKSFATQLVEHPGRLSEGGSPETHFLDNKRSVSMAVSL